MIPVGGGTKLHLGNLVRTTPLAIRTDGLQGILEYEPDNMTVSVAAGTSLQELQTALTAHRQFLPLDPPDPELSTVGGVVACNSSGPIRFRYGTVRDLLIGVRIVHADGTATKAGGKLVKNVTGYDMCKLYTGSLGTLGILTELTFKVQPQPEAVATALLGYPSIGAALEATQVFLKADLVPDAMEAWNDAAFRRLGVGPAAAPWVLMLRFGEVAPAVEWQLKRLQEVAPAGKGELLRLIETAESETFWRGAASARELPDVGEEALVKCSVLYQSTAATAALMQQTAEQLGAQIEIFCHAGTYILYGRYSWKEGIADRAELQRAFTSLRQHCVACGGHTVVEKIHAEAKKGFDVWGYQASSLELMRRIKREFDPKGLLNPGRFVGGI
jgi:glycolate oxidase FAD binding subunit